MTSMMDLIHETWYLKRDLVSADYDLALARLLAEFDVFAALPESAFWRKVHEYPSGKQVWTWKTPEEWICEQATLETLDGKRIIDEADHPLHVVSYSLPFEGVVAREELLPHIHTHPRLPDAIPFVFKYYDRDWGLCTTQVVKDSLTEAAYRVTIRSRFVPGKLKVGEIVVPGQSDLSFMLVAHLCHPAMVNDDLAGVVVGLDVMRKLLERVQQGWQPYYTYRFLILPETIGSVAYLSQHENLIPQMVGGLFLEMLGNDSPHALQGSYQTQSQPDRCFNACLPALDPQGYRAPYRTVVDNDERQFNAPGVRVPMLSLSRVEPAGSPTRPYPQYHSSHDRPEIVSQARLEGARDLTLGLLQAWENNLYPVNQFKGEVFCSGYGIWVDYRVNPEGHRLLFRIMESCDGEHTVADIATELKTTFQTVWEVVSLLQSKGLVSFSRSPVVTDPHRKG